MPVPQYRPATPVDIISHEPEVVVEPPQIQSQQHYVPEVSFEPQSEPWHQEYWSEPPQEHHHVHIDQPYQPGYQPPPQHQPEYRPEHQPSPEYKPVSQPEPQPVQYTTEARGEVPGPTHVIQPTPVALSTEHVRTDPQDPYTTEHMHVPALSVVPRYVRGEEHVSTYIQPPTHQPQVVHHEEQHWEPEPRPDHQEVHVFHGDHVDSASAGEHEAPGYPGQEAQAFEPPKAEWDASR